MYELLDVNQQEAPMGANEGNLQAKHIENNSDTLLYKRVTSACAANDMPIVTGRQQSIVSGDMPTIR